MAFGASTSPIVVAGTAYVQDQAGTVYAIDVSSGQVKWKTKRARLQYRPLWCLSRLGEAFRVHTQRRGCLPTV